MRILKDNNILIWSVLWVGARIFYQSGSQAYWIYEKIRKPSSVYYTLRNLWNFYRGIPKIHAWVSAVIEPVFGCNLRCAYCWGTYENAFREHPRPTLMSWELFQAAMDSLPGTVESVTFGGFGEPLLHPRILDMLEYAASRGKRTCLYTNAVLLQGKLLEDLAGSSLSTLNISMEPDGASSQMYRGVDFDQICRNIRHFSEKRRNGLELQFSVVVHEGNKRELAQFQHDWRGSVDAVKVSPQVHSMAEACAPSGACSELWRGNLFILTNGAVSLCCYDRHGKLPAGNVREGEISMGVPEGTVPLLESLCAGSIPEYCRTCAEIPCDNHPKRTPKKEDGRR